MLSSQVAIRYKDFQDTQLLASLLDMYLSGPHSLTLDTVIDEASTFDTRDLQVVLRLLHGAVKGAVRRPRDFSSSQHCLSRLKQSCIDKSFRHTEWSGSGVAVIDLHSSSNVSDCRCTMAQPFQGLVHLRLQGASELT